MQATKDSDLAIISWKDYITEGFSECKEHNMIRMMFIISLIPWKSRYKGIRKLKGQFQQMSQVKLLISFFHKMIKVFYSFLLKTNTCNNLREEEEMALDRILGDLKLLSKVKKNKLVKKRRNKILAKKW